MGASGGKNPVVIAVAVASGSLLAAALLWWHCRRRWHHHQREVAAALLPGPDSGTPAQVGPASPETRLEAGIVETFQDNCASTASIDSLAGAVATSTRVPSSKGGASFSKGTELSVAECGPHAAGDVGNLPNGPAPSTATVVDAPAVAASARDVDRPCTATVDSSANAEAAEPAAAAAAAEVAAAEAPDVTVPRKCAAAAPPALAGSDEQEQHRTASSFAIDQDECREELVPPDSEDLVYRRKSTLELRYEALDHFPKTPDANGAPSGPHVELPEHFTVAQGEQSNLDNSTRSVEIAYEALGPSACVADGQQESRDEKALMRATASLAAGCSVSNSPDDAKTS